MAIAGKLEIQLLADVARLRSDMNDVKSIVTGAGKHIEDVFAGARHAIELLGVGLSVEFFKHLTEGAIDAMAHLEDLSKTTGLTVEALSGLKIAAKQSGADLDSIASAVDKLAMNVGKAPDKFKALGISARDPIEQLKQLADVLNSIDDPNTRAAVAAAALGKAWQTAMPLLSEGSIRIGELIDAGTKAAGVTEDMAKKAKELDDKWILLAGSGGMVNRVVGAMLEPLIRLVDTMNAAKMASDGFLGTLVRFMTIGGDQAKDPAKAIGEIDTKLAALHKTADEFAAMGGLQRFFSADDIAIVKAQIAVLETQRQTLMNLQAVQAKPETEKPHVKDADAKGKDFLGTGTDWKQLAKDIEAYNAHVDKLQTEQINKSLEAGHAAFVEEQKNALERMKLADEISDAYVKADEKQRAASQAVMDASIAQGQSIADSLRSTAEMEAESYDFRLQQLNNYLDSTNLAVAQKNAIMESFQTSHEANMGSLSAYYAVERKKFAELTLSQQVTSMAGLLESLTASTAQKSREMFEINKIASMANAIVSTFEGANKALAMGPWGIPLAGVIIAAGLANVANIASTHFGSGAAPSAGGGGPGVTPVNIVPTVESGAGSGQTTIVQLQGDSFGRKQVQALLKQIAEQTKDGGRVVIG